MLSACANSSIRIDSNEVTVLPDVPADLKVCFDKLTKFAPTGPVSKSEALRLIARLRKSEVTKSKCGLRLLKLYEKASEEIKI